jgi:hypothetical protein
MNQNLKLLMEKEYEGKMNEMVNESEEEEFNIMNK